MNWIDGVAFTFTEFLPSPHEFVYNVCIDLERMLSDGRKFDEQKDEILSKSAASVRQFEKYFVPLLKKGARKADI